MSMVGTVGLLMLSKATAIGTARLFATTLLSDHHPLLFPLLAN